MNTTETTETDCPSCDGEGWLGDEGDVLCACCGGSGHRPGSCTVCGGSGRTRDPQSAFPGCEACRGTGVPPERWAFPPPANPGPCVVVETLGGAEDWDADEDWGDTDEEPF